MDTFPSKGKKRKQETTTCSGMNSTGPEGWGTRAIVAGSSCHVFMRSKRLTGGKLGAE